MDEIIEWLRSPEGEKWALDNAVYYFGDATRNEAGIFGSIKEDYTGEQPDDTWWELVDTAFKMTFKKEKQ